MLDIGDGEIRFDLHELVERPEYTHVGIVAHLAVGVSECSLRDVGADTTAQTHHRAASTFLVLANWVREIFIESGHVVQLADDIFRSIDVVHLTRSQIAFAVHRKSDFLRGVTLTFNRIVLELVIVELVHEQAPEVLVFLDILRDVTEAQVLVDLFLELGEIVRRNKGVFLSMIVVRDHRFDFHDLDLIVEFVDEPIDDGLGAWVFFGKNRVDVELLLHPFGWPFLFTLAVRIQRMVQFVGWCSTLKRIATAKVLTRAVMRQLVLEIVAGELCRYFRGKQTAIGGDVVEQWALSDELQSIDQLGDGAPVQKRFTAPVFDTFELIEFHGGLKFLQEPFKFSFSPVTIFNSAVLELSAVLATEVTSCSEHDLENFGVVGMDFFLGISDPSGWSIVRFIAEFHGP